MVWMPSWLSLWAARALDFDFDLDFVCVAAVEGVAVAVSAGGAAVWTGSGGWPALGNPRSLRHCRTIAGVGGFMDVAPLAETVGVPCC